MEYVEGVRVCDDCGVELVQERPPKRPDGGPLRWETVLATFNQGDVMMARSLLEGEGITHFAEADAFNRTRPFIVPVKFRVRLEEAGRARAVLADLDLSYVALDLRNGHPLAGIVRWCLAVQLTISAIACLMELVGMVAFFISLGLGWLLLVPAVLFGAASFAGRRARRGV